MNYIVHGVIMSQTLLSDFLFHFSTSVLPTLLNVLLKYLNFPYIIITQIATEWLKSKNTAVMVPSESESCSVMSHSLQPYQL